LTILIICLSIQLHYSFATYILVLIILCGLFKVKVSKKLILTSILIAVLCFSPYLLFKTQTFIPQNQGIDKTITKPNVSALLDFAKVLTLQNAIPNIIAPVSFRGNTSTPEVLKNFYYIITTISLFFLAFKLLVKRKQKLTVNFEKELILIIFFYVPGFIYEMANPKSGHYWYAFIFIIPQTLIVSYFLISLFQTLNQKITRLLFLTGLLIGLFIIAVTANNFIFTGIKKLKTSLHEGSYKNTKIFLHNLRKEINLSPQQFLEQVYFLDFRSSSHKRAFFAFDDKQIVKKSENSIKKFCYFISQVSLKKDQVRKLVQKSFLEDRTINRFPSRIFLLKTPEISKKFIITKYSPKFNQSCYNNQFSPFVVTKEIKDLLVHAKSIKLNNRHSAKYKAIFSDEKYDNNNELISFKGKFVVNSPVTQTPFQFNIDLEKIDLGYSLKGEIISHFYWASPNFNLDNLVVFFTRGSKIDPDSRDFKYYEILSKKTLASELNHLGNSDYWNYNRKWYRKVKFDPQYKFKKDEVKIGIIWSVLWENNKSTHFSKYSVNNMLKLLPQIKDWEKE
jgi:hypothetical protein